MRHKYFTYNCSDFSGDYNRDIFDYIEMFYNVKRRHGFNDQLSPVEYEKRFKNEATECLVNE